MHVPVSKPLLGEPEKKFAIDALDRGEISGLFGGYIPKFEKEFAAFCGTQEAVTTSSGTTALHLALATLKIGAGDEVIVQSFTNMATFFAVLYQGATPIAIDSEPETLNINPSLIEARITSKTKAILVVHIYGHPVDMDPVLELAQKYNLYVIEDAAEAHGAEYKGKKVGSIGDVGCFSFYANKILTTGEGGMLTFRNSEHAARARSLRALAFGSKNKFMHTDIGFNYRLTNLQAAVGCAQLGRITDILARKKTMAEYYLSHLSSVPEFRLPIQKEHCTNVYWMFNIVLQGSLKGKRAECMKYLADRGIETREDFIPFNMQKIFIEKGYTVAGECPVANDAAENGFYIPSGTDITEEEQAYVVKHMVEAATALR